MPTSIYLCNPTDDASRTIRKSVVVRKKFFWQALCSLLAFDLCGLGHNFPRLCRLLARSKIVDKTSHKDAVEQVCGAVNQACIWYPRKVLCLQRSAVTTCLLRRMGIPAKVVLGAQIFPFKAHAWTEVNNMPVNERKNVRAIYTVWN